MNIGEICTQNVVTADRASNLQQAAALMREHHVGTLVATTSAPDGVQAVGIVTDRDLVVEAMARGLDTSETQIGRLLDSKLAALPATASIDDAIAAMKEKGVRRLVVSDQGHLFGIVSLDDVLDALAHEMSEVAHAVRGGIERESAERRPLPPSVEPRTVRVPPLSVG